MSRLLIKVLAKELERQFVAKKSNLSPEKAFEIAKTIYSIKIKTPNINEVVTKTILLTNDQKMLVNPFDF